ncbi:GFA family protein [Kitasatospora sp. NPDC051705]|uniref:GFA family protein n=1 Tax=Kitasatospora sp. NPDC051705 TaxID=3364057 RepID=UPI00379D28BA
MPHLPVHPARTQRRSGGCLCGAIRFTVTGEPEDPHICGCAHCSHRAGSPFQWWTGFPLAGLSWTGDHGEPTWYDTHAGRTMRGFCPVCGSHIAALDHGDTALVGILVTALDGYRGDPAHVPLNPNRLPEAAPWLAPAAHRTGDPSTSV